MLDSRARQQEAEREKRWEKRLFDRPIFDKAHHEQANDEITLDAKITAQPTRTHQHMNFGPIFFVSARMFTTVFVFFSSCCWLQLIRLFIWVRFAPLHPTEFIQCIVYHIPDKIKLKKCHAKRPKDICTFRCMVCALNLSRWLLFLRLMRWTYAKFATHTHTKCQLSYINFKIFIQPKIKSKNVISQASARFTFAICTRSRVQHTCEERFFFAQLKSHRFDTCTNTNLDYTNHIVRSIHQDCLWKISKHVQRSFSWRFIRDLISLLARRFT